MNLLGLLALLWIANGSGAKEKNYMFLGKEGREAAAKASSVAVPVTFYLEQIERASTQGQEFLYFNLSMCEKGLGTEEQAKLTLTLPNNPTWDIYNLGYVVVQLSHKPGEFTPSSVFATNYDWRPPNVPAISTLVWKLNSTNQNIYIRALALNVVSEFSMEMSFVTGQTQSYYRWSSDYPFEGQQISGRHPISFLQYWRAEKTYSVKNNHTMWFQLAFCEQGQDITGMVTTVSGSLDARYSLMEQWACMTNIPVASCTQPESIMFWRNTPAAFNSILEEEDGPGKDTQNGIWLAVYGTGGDPTFNNNFTVIAQTITTN